MKSPTIIIVILFIASDIFVWHSVVFGGPRSTYEIDFLDIGQGDSSLIQLPGGTQVLIDAGPDTSVFRELEQVLPTGDHSIDIGIITHPQLDHFGGYDTLLSKYHFGVMVFNGITDSPYAPKEWKLLEEKAEREHIPLIAVQAGDKIRIASSTFEIISPNPSLIQSAELNDTGVVSRLVTPKFKALFTADIGFTVEDILRKKFDVSADILKVGHHGSKTSSGSAFLHDVHPKVAVIMVGAKNRYGHPGASTLARIASGTGAAIFRTDQDGTVRVVVDGDILRVFKDKK